MIRNQSIDSTRLSHADAPGRTAPTEYAPNVGCEPVGRRDDVVSEARSIARVATAKAMNFVRSEAGRAALRDSGDRYVDVLREYANSALAQRCNPIRVSVVGESVRGVDANGDGVTMAGDASSTKISLSRRGMAEPNLVMTYDKDGIIKDSIRRRDGSYSTPVLFLPAAANYIMRYHGALNTDASMMP